MNINNYKTDGFSKVCDVIVHPDREDQWYYQNVDHKFVGPDHKSWLYFIVKGDVIVKCGESGNPLLLETKGKNPRWKKNHLGKIHLGKIHLGPTRELEDQMERWEK